MPTSEDFPVIDRSVTESLDSIKWQTPKGTDAWWARDLQPMLGYGQWKNFSKAIKRARQACESAGTDQRLHFADVRKDLPPGLPGPRAIEDVALTRYAAYLIAMNGDSNKPEIAAAQAYFAVQARRQEQTDALSETDARIELRDRVKENVKALNSAAKDAGVEQFGLFHDAGYRGLYGGMGLTQIKAVKGLASNEELLDRAGRAELAANDFRITQTEDKLRREQIAGEINARRTHHDVGQEVRQTIEKLGGTTPEKLPAEPSIKKLASQRRRAGKQLPTGKPQLASGCTCGRTITPAGTTTWPRFRYPTPACARAARRVLTSSIARVMGPTPPGTGVMAPAFSATGP